ncbi:chitin synthase C [Aspergillus udagawae]|uniref:Chitin synthase C n=1 Tax=Aspergillus udagawae TaxID=91492 RepID=A0A8H3RNL6_9EURO|nr:chitin synthase C [Aspergillus udagawae]
MVVSNVLQPILAIRLTDQKASNNSKDRSISPVIPMSMALAPAHSPVGNGDTAGCDQSPTKGLTSAEKPSSIDGKAHENIPCAIYNQQAVNEASVSGSDGWFKLEESQCMGGTQDGVDAKTDRDDSQDGGEDRDIRNEILDSPEMR